MMKLQDVILKAMAKKISWLAAAEIAGMSDRTMRRMRQRYQEFGCTGRQRHVQKKPAARPCAAGVNRQECGKPVYCI
jgi:hypothetical protein